MEKPIDRIEKLRLERKLSKTDIWKAAGATSGAYTFWLDGSEIKADKLRKIADFLKVSFYWLETGKDDKTPVKTTGSLVVAGKEIQSIEQQLIDMYRGMNQCHKEALEQLANALYLIDNPNDKLAAGKKPKREKNLT